MSERNWDPLSRWRTDHTMASTSLELEMKEPFPGAWPRVTVEPLMNLAISRRAGKKSFHSECIPCILFVCSGELLHREQRQCSAIATLRKCCGPLYCICCIESHL
jgi:hypothetical protein